MPATLQAGARGRNYSDAANRKRHRLDTGDGYSLAERHGSPDVLTIADYVALALFLAFWISLNWITSSLHFFNRPSLTKAMIEGYDGYKDNAPGATGLSVKTQTKNWAVPVHKGAVRAFKEAGAWSDDQEKYNNALFKRQEVLLATWADYIKGNPSSDPAKFTEEWMKLRKAALTKAGMTDIFE